MDQAIAGTIIATAQEILTHLADPHHPIRRRFDQEVRVALAGLPGRPPYRDTVNQIVSRLLEGEAVRLTLDDLWSAMRQSVEHDVSAPSSRLHAIMGQALRALARALKEDAVLRERINRRIAAAVLAVPWRSGIERFVAEVIQRWDDRATTRRLERALGNDLQYIRLNGTLVGGMLGLVIHLVIRAFAP